MFEELIYIFFIFAYISCFGLFFAHFELDSDHWKPKAERVTYLTLFLHVCMLLCFYSHKPYFFEKHAELVAAFLIIGASFFIENRLRVQSLMIFSIPMGLLCLVLGWAHVRRFEETGLITASYLSVAHVIVVVSGASIMLLSAALAFMYMFLSHKLKTHQLGHFLFKFTSLEKIDKMHFRCLSLGVVIYSIGVVIGVLLASDIGGSVHVVLKDPKVVLSFLTCMVYWMVLGFRLSALRRGKRIAASTTLAVLLLLATLVSQHHLASMGS